MPRYHMINGKNVPFTKEEEAEKDAEESAWLAKNPPISQEEYDRQYKKNKYQRDRQPEYPPMTDYLDGIVKGDQAQVDKYIADCLAVKEKYPKGGN